MSVKSLYLFVSRCGFKPYTYFCVDVSTPNTYFYLDNGKNILPFSIQKSVQTNTNFYLYVGTNIVLTYVQMKVQTLHLFLVSSCLINVTYEIFSTWSRNSYLVVVLKTLKLFRFDSSKAKRLSPTMIWFNFLKIQCKLGQIIVQ